MGLYLWLCISDDPSPSVSILNVHIRSASTNQRYDGVGVVRGSGWRGKKEDAGAPDTQSKATVEELHPCVRD